MIAVIFEVWPENGRKQEYLDIAASLRPLLDSIDGFVSIERFQSLVEPGKILHCPSGATKRPLRSGANSSRIAPRKPKAERKSSRIIDCA
jgi:hypothetical protein